MRRMALVIVAASLYVVGAGPAPGQLIEVQLPDTDEVQLPLPDVPEVELPPPPGGTALDDGGSDPTSSLEAPGGGESTSASGGSAGSGERGGGSSQTGSCPCAAPATGNPVAGDYDKCPLDAGGSTAVLAAAGSGTRRSGGEGSTFAGGVLGTDAYGPPVAREPITLDAGVDPLSVTILALAAFGLLVGVAGGLKALHGRLRG